MKIDVLTVDGSPKNITPPDIYNRGVGGAELALMSWATVMAKRGHKITIYNQTKYENFTYDGVDYKPDITFDPVEYRDILITFRGPQDIALSANAKKKIGWSCDQFTLGNYVGWYRDMDKIILISDFHKQDHIQRYGKIVEEKGQVIDLGVRTWEYEPIEKIPYQFIFCSVPDRGLNELAFIWPTIKEQIPEATLIITSDYTLWGAPEPLNVPYKLRFAGIPGVKFVGNVPRKELVKYQLQSEIHIYPCIYDENACIAAMETQVAGCYLITTDRAALETTNFTGVKVSLENFVDEVVKFYSLNEKQRSEKFYSVSKVARERFNWDRIAILWEELFQ